MNFIISLFKVEGGKWKVEVGRGKLRWKVECLNVRYTRFGIPTNFLTNSTFCFHIKYIHLSQVSFKIEQIKLVNGYFKILDINRYWLWKIIFVFRQFAASILYSMTNKLTFWYEYKYMFSFYIVETFSVLNSWYVPTPSIASFFSKPFKKKLQVRRLHNNWLGQNLAAIRGGGSW